MYLIQHRPNTCFNKQDNNKLDLQWHTSIQNHKLYTLCLLALSSFTVSHLNQQRSGCPELLYTQAVGAAFGGRILIFLFCSPTPPTIQRNNSKRKSNRKRGNDYEMWTEMQHQARLQYGIS